MRTRITRFRRALVWLTGLMLAVAAAPSAPAQPIELEFVVWNYAIDTIQSNIDRFEESHPNIRVNLTEYTWQDYHDTMVLRLKGGTRTDVMYGGEDWLAEWAAAGWLAPIEQYYPAIRDKYAKNVAQYAIDDMTYRGQMYGLPYYADLFTFQYNAQILEEHGIAVPETWDDVLEASLKLQEAGISKPLAYTYNQELPQFYQEFVSQVYGRGGAMFDEELRPLFDDPDSAAWKQLQWLQDAVTEHEIVSMQNSDPDVVTAMNTGKQVFAVMWNYLLAALNDEATQPRAGQFRLALMPGETHNVYGFAKFYAMTTQAAQDPERREAAWTFIEYMGGENFRVARRWAVENGLGFAQLPLYDDPEVRDAWSSWIDMDLFKRQAQLARNGAQAEWKGIWVAFFRPLLAKAMVGDITVQEAMEQGAAKWNEYRGLMVRGLTPQDATERGLAEWRGDGVLVVTR